MRAFGEHKDRRTATDGDPVSRGWKGTKTALPSGQNGNSRLSLKFVHAQTGLNAHGHGYTLLMAAGTHGGAAESKTTRARARARARVTTSGRPTTTRQLGWRRRLAPVRSVRVTT
jgi:hypothetical protein